MGTIFTLFMVLIMIASILLIIMVMAQNPKGGGLSGTFGGTSSAQFGVQRTNDFMEKATWTLGIIIVVLILLSVILTAKPSQAFQKAAPAKTEAPAPQTAPGTNNAVTMPIPAPADK
ncbi:MULTISPECIES: preprotein translocase subunit SecG [unclassified Kaistella]|uniref:preprotein translocase subunit SecG n=1 Tax=unclassified Kaistella TaxID=2762626 RepID=UPI002736B85B|nr:MULTISPECIES: preprotein translocase subunit SecG [unclassified Kaistella]MDP2453116.1 preprotein translocase subunit SecG [Kaistella sp. SH11-4b]MDP2456173.1 preprotein translocase subunit SecG [Kaistella sp. SH40-3]MDP2458929.1 preprotein translocase subunit SecG [Kaistella sp. SH19-2b]